MMKLQDYKKRMTVAFTNNTKRGFVDWRDCGKLCMDVTEGLEEAKEDLCAENRYSDLFSLANRTYVKWNNTDKDDSNGETQEFCTCVDSIWETIYCDGEEYVSHDAMLETMLGYLDGRLFDYMEDEIYDFVLRHFKSERQLIRKEQFLRNKMDEIKQHLSTEDTLEYSLCVLEGYYARILADQRRPIREIRDFLNAGYRYFNRELLAQIEKEYGNYDEAIALYKSQIEDNPDSHWSDGPRKALMEIYTLQGNTKAYNDELYNMMCAHTDEEKYYLEYKSLFIEDDWKEEWNRLLDHFKDRLSAINLWLSIEGRYDIIMDNAEPDNEYVIDAYGKMLYKLYPERCLTVLSNIADRQVKSSKNRRDYRHIARTLKKITALPGGRELATELAVRYRAEYPRRTAMLDELWMFYSEGQ